MHGFADVVCLFYKLGVAAKQCLRLLVVALVSGIGGFKRIAASNKSFNSGNRSLQMLVVLFPSADVPRRLQELLFVASQPLDPETGHRMSRLL